MNPSILIQWSVVLVLVAACLLQFAVYMAPDICEGRHPLRWKRPLLAGLVVSAIYLGYSSWIGYVVDKPLTLSVALLALSASFRANSQLLGE